MPDKEQLASIWTEVGHFPAIRGSSYIDDCGYMMGPGPANEFFIRGDVWLDDDQTKEVCSYELRFHGTHGVLYLDWEDYSRPARMGFGEVKNSRWLPYVTALCQGEHETPPHQHYILAGYDLVLEILCDSYTFSYKFKIK